jgi:hypothetical protein
MFSLFGTALINCNTTLSNLKQWYVYQIDPTTGLNMQQITSLTTNPTLNYAQIVLQPQSLPNGLYRFVYVVSMINPDTTVLSGQAETFVQITPSGLVLSTLSLSSPMYGGTIEISRGHNQAIPFNPYLFSYDIDAITIITSLTFKYACQIIDSNVEQGYPKNPFTNQNLQLDELKLNPSLKYLDNCFSSTSKKNKYFYLFIKNFI